MPKISIPEKILETPKKLTDEEFLIMKMHVKYSKEIIQEYVSSEVVEAVYRHHEKLNGKGYPQGLSAKDLTSVQKIITVTDAFDVRFGNRFANTNLAHWQKILLPQQLSAKDFGD